jgi:hypothetical protein
MNSPDTPAAASDPNLPAAIARAERLRGMLERLAELGMAMAEDIAERQLSAPCQSEPRHEPGRSFADVSRAVRLTAALVLRLDADIIAMCNGEAPPRRAASAEAGRPFAFGAKAPPCPVREKVREAVYAVIDGEIGDVDVAMLALDRAHETLTERDDIDRFLDRPLRDCVAAICADLGLAPDWSLWSDDAGFAAPEAGPAHDWSRLWTYDPDHLAARLILTAVRPPPPPLGGGPDSRLQARVGWGDGAAPVVTRSPESHDSRPLAHPPPGSRPDAASPPSPLRGREGHGDSG